MKANISEYSEEKKALGLLKSLMTTPKKKIDKKQVNMPAIFRLHARI